MMECYSVEGWDEAWNCPSHSGEPEDAPLQVHGDDPLLLPWSRHRSLEFIMSSISLPSLPLLSSGTLSSSTPTHLSRLLWR